MQVLMGFAELRREIKSLSTTMEGMKMDVEAEVEMRYVDRLRNLGARIEVLEKEARSSRQTKLRSE